MTLDAFMSFHEAATFISEGPFPFTGSENFLKVALFVMDYISSL